MEQHGFLLPSTRQEVTDALRTALDALLAAPRSIDSHGYLHYVDPDLLEAVEEAYRQEKEP